MSRQAAVPRLAPADLHMQATASSLGLARVLVFGIWLYHLAVDPLQRLSELPRSAFRPPGVLAVVPGRIGDVALRSSSLLAFKFGLLVFDGLTVRPWRTRARPGDRAPYVTGMLVACLVLSLTYFFVGAVRLWKGVDLFGTSTLRDLVSSFALQDGRFDGAGVVPSGVPAGILVLPPLSFKAAFAASTLIELSAPLALFGRRLRPFIVTGLLLFHLSILVAMQVPFPENMCLLALFSGTWFHRVATWLDRSPSTARSAGR